MPRTQRIEAVRASIDLLRDLYGQENFTNPCGTPACVAGHAAACAGEEALLTQYAEAWATAAAAGSDYEHHPTYLRCDRLGTALREAAAAWLGLTEQQAGQMFVALPRCATCDGDVHASAGDALRMLEQYASNGPVEWHHRSCLATSG